MDARARYQITGFTNAAENTVTGDGRESSARGSIQSIVCLFLLSSSGNKTSSRQNSHLSHSPLSCCSSCILDISSLFYLPLLSFLYYHSVTKGRRERRHSSPKNVSQISSYTNTWWACVSVCPCLLPSSSFSPPGSVGRTDILCRLFSLSILSLFSFPFCGHWGVPLKREKGSPSFLSEVFFPLKDSDGWVWSRFKITSWTCQRAFIIAVSDRATTWRGTREIWQKEVEELVRDGRVWEKAERTVWLLRFSLFQNRVPHSFIFPFLSLLPMTPVTHLDKQSKTTTRTSSSSVVRPSPSHYNLRQSRYLFILAIELGRSEIMERGPKGRLQKEKRKEETEMAVERMRERTREKVQPKRQDPSSTLVNVWKKVSFLDDNGLFSE